MYCLVVVVPRYLGPFFVLLCSGIACGVRATNSQESKKLLAQSSIVMLAMLIVSIGSSTIQSLTRDVILRDSSPHLHWEVANDLSRMGIKAGDKVAFIGAAFFEYWARLARVKIVAEIPQGSTEKFWSAGPEVKSQVYSLLAKAGAKALITNQRVIHVSTEGWRQIGNTGYYLYLLQ